MTNTRSLLLIVLSALLSSCTTPPSISSESQKLSNSGSLDEYIAFHKKWCSKGSAYSRSLYCGQASANISELLFSQGRYTESLYYSANVIDTMHTLQEEGDASDKICSQYTLKPGFYPLAYITAASKKIIEAGDGALISRSQSDLEKIIVPGYLCSLGAWRPISVQGITLDKAGYYRDYANIFGPEGSKMADKYYKDIIEPVSRSNQKISDVMHPEKRMAMTIALYKNATAQSRRLGLPSIYTEFYQKYYETLLPYLKSSVKCNSGLEATTEC